MKYSIITSCIAIVLLNGCATILSKSAYDVRIDSSPKAAIVTIYNRQGLEVYSGQTPCHAMLKPGGGYFKKAVYSIEFSKPGYSDRKITLRADLNGWYFGNLLIGGPIGFLIVDPATGAMYKLKNTDINASLDASGTFQTNAVPSVMIYALNEIPEAWTKQLVPVNVK